MRPFRPRISLLSALVLMTLVGVVIVILQSWRNVGPLRSEVRRLKGELGELVIEDDSKMHAVYRKTYQENTWRWRVFFPEKARYFIYLSANRVPRDAFPERSHRHSYGFGPARHLPVKGEYEVTVAIREDESGEHQAVLEFTVVDTGAADAGWTGFSLKRPLRLNGGIWPEGPEGAFVTEGNELKSRRESDGRLLLLRHRVYRTPDKALEAPETTEGLIVWIEKQQSE